MRAAWADGTAGSTRARARGRARRLVVVALMGVGAALALPTVAGAEPVGTYGTGSTVVTDPGRSQAHDPPAASTDDPASLPFTGGDVAGLVALGAGALGAGLIVSRVRRNTSMRTG